MLFLNFPTGFTGKWEVNESMKYDRNENNIFSASRVGRNLVLGPSKGAGGNEGRGNAVAASSALRVGLGSHDSSKRQ